MQHKIIRRLAFVIFTLAIAVVIRIWSDNSTKGTTSSASTGAAQQGATYKSNVDGDPAVVATAHVAPGVPARGLASTNASSPNASVMPQDASVQINVSAPGMVRAGESFEATVNLDAPRGIRRLAFSVTYDKSVLQLTGSSQGTLVQQGSAPAQFGAEEPSDGNILVELDVSNGGAIAGTGSVAVLEFQALKAGASLVTVRSITFVDSGDGSTSVTSSAPETVVNVN